MPDLAIRLGSKEFDLANLLSAILPDDLESDVQAILDDPQRSLDLILDQLRERVPDKFQFFLSNIQDLTSHELNLFEVAQSRSPTAAIGLELGAAASVRVRKLILDDGSDAALVGYGLLGNVSLGAAAKAASAVVSVGLNAGKHASRMIEFGIEPTADLLVLATLPELAAALVDPSDFTAIAAKMQATPLRRVARSGETNNTLGVDVGINQALAGALSGIGVTLSGQAGASLAVRYQDAADFSLSVERTKSGYVIDLSKTRKKSTSSVLKLGVDVQLVGLKHHLLDKLTAALPDAQNVRTLLDEFDAQVEKLSEDHLKSTLSTALTSKWPDAAPLFTVLLGQQTVDEFAAQIQQELHDRIDDLVNAKVDLVNERASAAAQSVLNALAQELNLPTSLKTQLDDYLEAALAKGIEDLQKAFSSATIVKKLLPNGKVRQLLSPLQGISSTVDQVLQKAASAHPPAKELAGALRDVYGRYVRFRQQVIGIVKNDLEEQFALAVISEKSRREITSHTLRLEVPNAEAANPAVTDLYQKLWNGDLRQIGPLVRALPSTVMTQGEYVRTVERLEALSISLNVFGLGLSSQTVFSDKVRVGFDYTGKLVVTSSEAEISRRFSSIFFWSKESQTVLARWQLDFLNKAFIKNPVSIELSVRDDKFKLEGEVEDFFEPLQLVGIVRPGLADDVVSTLFEGGAKSLRNVVISLSVPLAWRAWEDLLMHADLIELLRVYLQRVMLLDPDELDQAKRYMERAGVNDLLIYLLHLGRQSLANAQEEAGFPTVVNAPPKFQMAYFLGRSVRQLQVAIESSRESWLKVNEAVSDPSVTSEVLEGAVGQFNEDFSKQFRGLLLRTAIDNRGAISWRTAALLGFFRSLKSPESGLNPFVSCTFRVGEGEAQILS